jgi:hypothetical protein
MFGIFKGGRENQAPHDAEAPRQERSIEDAAYDRFFTEIGGAVGAVGNDMRANSAAVKGVIRSLYTETGGNARSVTQSAIHEAFKYEAFASAIIGGVGKMSVDTNIEIDSETAGVIMKKLYADTGGDPKKVSPGVIHEAFMAVKKKPA